MSRTAPLLPCRERRSLRGIALPAMVFLIVIVGLLLAAGLAMLMQSQHGQVLQLQSARALAAAKTGTEWGLWQVSDPQGALGLASDTLPPCFSTQPLNLLPAPLDSLQVQVSCIRAPATGSIDEGGLKLVSYRVLAVATFSNSGNNDYVSRQYEARHTVCKNPGGAAPLYAC